jgi:hypothetical protein
LIGKVVPIMRRRAPPGKWLRDASGDKARITDGFLSLPILESMPRFFEIIFTGE